MSHPSCPVAVAGDQLVLGAPGLGLPHARPPLRAAPLRATTATRTRITRAGLDPALVAGRGATVAFVEQEAENAVTDGEKIGPSREAYTLARRGFRAHRSTAHCAGQYVEFTLSRPGERVDPAVQHSRRASGWRDHGAARRHGQRQAQADDDADVGVRLAVRHVSVLQRPERRPEPRLVEARAGPGDQAVPAEPLLRRAATAARQDLPGRRQGPLPGPGGHVRLPGTCSTWPTSNWSAQPIKQPREVLVGAGFSAPTRPAGATRLRRSSGPSRRRRRSAGRSSSRRAPTR